MAFAFVQTKDNNQSTSSSTNIITPTSPLTAGNLVVVHLRLVSSGLTISSVTDSKGNVYAQANSIAFSTGSLNYQYYGVQVIGGATSVTVNLSSSGTSKAVIDEYSGGAATNATVFDKSSTGSNTVSTTSASVTSFSPISSGELVVAGLMTFSNVTSITAGTSYTIANNIETSIGTQYLLSATTTETAPISWTTSSAWVEIASAYIPLGSTPPTITYITYNPPFLS